MKIGAHVRSSGGLTTAFERAKTIGAETIQIFGAPPQMWRRRKIREDECKELRALMAETEIGPVFIHGPYLINLATQDPELLTKSTDALSGDLRLASAIGAAGVIFHVGSHKGAGFGHVLPQIVDALHKVLDETPDDAQIILENSAGMGGSVGSKFDELGAIIKGVASARLKVCLDTEHAYAAGYNVAVDDGLAETIAEFEREIGLEPLVAVHANDSKIELGGGVDRHENIGEGHIGREGFKVIMAHPALRNVPFLLEVPGLDGEGPDKPNIDILKKLRAKLGAD